MHSKIASFSVLGLLLSVTAVLAHEGATGVVKERMDLMETQKEAMKVIGQMAKGKTPFDAAKAAVAAGRIGTTAKEIPNLFPKGSDGHPSEAKPEVWTQWDKFTADADALERAAAILLTALDDGEDDWKARFKSVIDACKGCHKTFRAEEKN